MLDEEYVKRLFAGGIFRTWDPEDDAWWGAQRALFAQQRLDVIRLTNPKDKTVLDAGTGKARFAISFALAGAGEVKAVDISEEMLAIANRRARKAGVASKILFEQGDAEQLKYADEHFDIVCCMETFVHLPNPAEAVRELTRVCKVGGVVIANVTNNDPLSEQYYPTASKPPAIGTLHKALRSVYHWKALGILRVIRRRYFNRRREKVTKPYYRHYSRSEFLQLFNDVPLEVEQVLEYGTPVPVFFLVLARKESP